MAAPEHRVIEVVGIDDFHKRLARSQKTVVKFYRPGCIYCEMSASPYEQLAASGKWPNVDFFAVDADRTKNHDIVYSVADLGKTIGGVPDFLFFRNGKHVDQLEVLGALMKKPSANGPMGVEDNLDLL